MSLRDEVRDCFPELAELDDDDDLRSGVVEAWAIALAENGSPDLASLPWLGPYRAELGLSDELLVDHIRDVAAVSVAIADALVDRRGAPLDLDTVLAGALVHDVSQVGEVDGEEWTRVGRLLGHPHYGVYLVLAAGLPVEIAHVILSHTSATTVEPATLEAAVVMQADGATASAIRSRAYEDLRDAPPAGPHA
jgi:hypothetical protein